MALPDVEVEVLDGALGVMPPGSGRPMAIVGVAEKGPLNTPAAFARIDAIISNYGYGPAVEAAAYALERYGKPVVFVRSGDSEPAEIPDADESVMTYGGCDELDDSGVTGTSTITIASGATCNDDYEAVVRFLSDGTIGQAGITYQWSLDGGRTWSAVTALGTANSITIPNSGGAKIDLGVGDINAGDKVSFRCVAPRWTAQELSDALKSLENTKIDWEFVEVVGPVDADAADTIDAALASMSAKGLEKWAIGHTRMPHPGESTTDYMTAMTALSGAITSRKLCVTSGATKTLSSISKRRYRRPLSFALAPRIASVSEEISVAEIDLGPLPGVQIIDKNGNPDEYDESVTPGLDDLRFTVARSHNRIEGVYVNIPRIMAPTGSDFDRVHLVRVMNIYVETLRDYFIRRLHKPIRVSKQGFIVETDAVELERGAVNRAASKLLKKPKASDLRVVVSRTDNILSTRLLNVEARLTPLGYAEAIKLVIGFENPALEVV